METPRRPVAATLVSALFALLSAITRPAAAHDGSPIAPDILQRTAPPAVYIQETPPFEEATAHLREGQLDAALEDFRTAREEGVDGDKIGAKMLSIGDDDMLDHEEYELAARVFEAAFAFADDRELQHQLHLFAGYAHYEAGKKIDEANTPPQDCEPARKASDHFRRVPDALDNAGSYQEEQQNQIRRAAEQLLYRQEQIIEKAC